MTQNDKVDILEELRREKELVRREVKDSEGRLAGHWTYLSDNAMPLILNSTVNGISAMLGFGYRTTPKSAALPKQPTESTGIFQNIYGSMMAYSPLIWEIAKPMLIRYAVNRVKSLFTRKKKKKNRDDD